MAACIAPRLQLRKTHPITPDLYGNDDDSIAPTAQTDAGKADELELEEYPDLDDPKTSAAALAVSSTSNTNASSTAATTSLPKPTPAPAPMQMHAPAQPIQTFQDNQVQPSSTPVSLPPPAAALQQSTPAPSTANFSAVNAMSNPYSNGDANGNMMGNMMGMGSQSVRPSEMKDEG
jgi:hypothetical protein